MASYTGSDARVTKLTILNQTEIMRDGNIPTHGQTMFISPALLLQINI